MPAFFCHAGRHRAHHAGRPNRWLELVLLAPEPWKEAAAHYLVSYFLTFGHNRNVCFGSLADTQMPENFQTVGFGAQDASANVCFRPEADTSINPKGVAAIGSNRPKGDIQTPPLEAPDA